MVDITDITFNVTIYFANGQIVNREVELPKAAKLAMKKNMFAPEDTDYVEVKGVNNSLIIPIAMNFYIDAAPNFKATAKISRYMLYKRDQGRCSYCGKEITQKEATIDHIIPKSQGGLNVWENIALSCKKCNCAKDSKTPEQAGMKLLVTPYNPKLKK